MRFACAYRNYERLPGLLKLPAACEENSSLLVSTVKLSSEALEVLPEQQF
jgi:hypothetical protein